MRFLALLLLVAFRMPLLLLLLLLLLPILLLLLHRRLLEVLWFLNTCRVEVLLVRGGLLPGGLLSGADGAGLTNGVGVWPRALEPPLT